MRSVLRTAHDYQHLQDDMQVARSSLCLVAGQASVGQHGQREHDDGLAWQVRHADGQGGRPRGPSHLVSSASDRPHHQGRDLQDQRRLILQDYARLHGPPSSIGQLVVGDG
ncbi:unnamed protein product [Sphagnum balticum]